MAPLGPRIGLFGGSFDPAHLGHLHLATTAKRACRLDQVWWMPSPQNPLKPEQPSWDSRADTVRDLPLPPGHVVSDIEVELGTNYTVDLLQHLTTNSPDVRWVFLMGADNLAQLPRWKDWQRIFELVPICVVARPGPDALRARLGRAARQFGHARIPESQAHTLPDRAPPAWAFLTTPHNSLSSSAIRATASG